MPSVPSEAQKKMWSRSSPRGFPAAAAHDSAPQDRQSALTHTHYDTRSFSSETSELVLV